LLVRFGVEFNEAVATRAVIARAHDVSTLRLEALEDGEERIVVDGERQVGDKESRVGDHLRALLTRGTGRTRFLLGRGSRTSTGNRAARGRTFRRLLGDTAARTAGLYVVPFLGGGLTLSLTLTLRARFTRRTRFPRGALLGFLGNLNLDRALEQGGVVELGHRGAGLSGRRELNEAIPEGTTTARDNARAFHGANLTKKVEEILIRGAEGEITDEDLGGHGTLV